MKNLGIADAQIFESRECSGIERFRRMNLGIEPVGMVLRLALQNCWTEQVILLRFYEKI